MDYHCCIGIFNTSNRFCSDAIPMLGNVDDFTVLLAGLIKEYADYKKKKSNGV